MPFEVVGDIARIETIAAGKGIRDLQRLDIREGPMEEAKGRCPRSAAERGDTQSGAALV
jgi:hypothetical protein